MICGEVNKWKADSDTYIDRDANRESSRNCTLVVYRCGKISLFQDSLA